MRIQVYHVHIPALSTVGYGEGYDQEGRPVTFLGDHRPMRDLGRVVRNATEPVSVEVEPWQLVEGRTC
jgi:hypothetical protein